ncbi:MAG: DUF3372 domain-containing protein [Betaproteobacteria bacterium]|nr:DUF3372 domain-containing protein [Betaproteobacteria bacterium]
MIVALAATALPLCAPHANATSFARLNSEDCDRRESFRILKAEPPGATLAAEAIWVDERRLIWPGANSDRVRLLVTDDALISFAVGSNPPATVKQYALSPFNAELDADTKRAVFHMGDGPVLVLGEIEIVALRELHKSRMVVVTLDETGGIKRASRIQAARALDSLFADAAALDDLGVTKSGPRANFKLWAPTASRVHLCLYPDRTSNAIGEMTMRENAAFGVWSSEWFSNGQAGFYGASAIAGIGNENPLRMPRASVWRTSVPRVVAPHGPVYYTYLVDIWVPGVGLVRNRVTDPYSISLSANSKRSLVATLDDPELMPPGWNEAPRRPALAAQTDLVAFELHLRDFSMSDVSVPAPHRGKYLAFTHAKSNGMQHLSKLARAGVTDVHLLPVFDIATIDETNCTTPTLKGGASDTAQRDLLAKTKASDCYNWGYDPFHYTAPEGSYATDANNGVTRVREFRQMVMGLNKLGLRVGMDVVYNHTAASGQADKSVLDRIVPGYYHRLNAKGEMERSTCCENTATEHRMMEKLMSDSVLAWAKHYRIDSFRFDLMGHQPRAAMERLRDRLKRELGRDVPLIGEGWNFGEIENGKRFVQASQLSLPGTGIATFSDRARDAARGGSHADSGNNLVALQGYLNGLSLDPNTMNAGRDQREALVKSSDLLRVGLLGSVATVALTDYRGAKKQLSAFDYNGQPAGYVAEPGEVVNYVENHDNQTLFDINALRLPRNTTKEDRARMQVLGGALTLFSQGVAYVHAGIEILRSKSLDRNSFDSGDHFNRIDWTYNSNNFAQGLPPVEGDAGRDDPVLAETLNDPRIAPSKKEILWTRDAFLDLLRIRASSTLFRLRTAKDIGGRVTMLNTGPDQVPGLLGAIIDGADYTGANFKEVAYFINAAPRAVTIRVPQAASSRFELHPVQRANGAADKRVQREAKFDATGNAFLIPARSAVVFVRK